MTEEPECGCADANTLCSVHAAAIRDALAKGSLDFPTMADDPTVIEVRKRYVVGSGRRRWVAPTI